MIGRQAVRIAAERKLEIIATSRTRPAQLPGGCEWREWNLTDRKSDAELDALFPDVDTIFHLGAAVISPGVEIDNETLLETNVRAVERLATWAANGGVGFIFVSSATVYADTDQLKIVESARKTDGEGLGGYYGYAKLLAEQALTALAPQGLRSCILRPSSVYGPGLHPKKMICRFLSQASRGETLRLTAPTSDRVDLIYSADVANAMFAAAESESFGIFNVASGRPVSIREIAETCVKAAGRGSVALPDEAQPQSAPVRFDLNCDAARRAFGFAPATSLEDGLRQMLDAGVG